LVDVFYRPGAVTEIQASDGTQLHAHRYAVADPRAEILLLHGYGEHAGRYEWTAERWNAEGLAVTTVDLRGHGKSAGDRGRIHRFEEYHLDAQALLDHVRAVGSSAPMFLFGHSMGALLALHWLLHRGVHGFRGLALSSPYLGLAVELPTWKRMAGEVLSLAAPTLGLDSGLEGTKVAKDPEIARWYDQDPLNFSQANTRWFTEANRAQREVLADAHQIRIPVLLLYGGEDVVADPEAADRLAQHLTNVESQRMVGLYHEILNEPEPTRSEVAHRYAAWFLAHA
jgi:lysophospholipase